MTFQYAIKTRYSETAQDGIVHHSSYVVYLEVARLEFFKTLDFDINTLEQAQMYCSVIDVSIQYKKPLYSSDDIVVHIAVGEIKPLRFSLEYKVIRDEELVAKAMISHCFVGKTFKPEAIPQAVVSRLKSVLGQA